MRRSRWFFLAPVVCAACSGDPAEPETFPVSTASDAGANAAADAAAKADGATEPLPALAVASAVDIGALAMPVAAFGRDGGTSALVGNKLLWVFGDTFLDKVAVDGQKVRSGTAAWGTVADPLAIVDTLDANGAPYELVPFTSEEAAANKADALNGWALWPGHSFANASGTEAVVLFQKIKRSVDPKTGSAGYNAVSTGAAHLEAGKTTATRDATPLFSLPDRMWGAQGTMVADGFAYLYSCMHTTGFNFDCGVARAPIADVANRAAYTFYDGTTWGADASKAAVIGHDGAGMSVSYNPYLRRYVSVGNKLLSSSIAIRTALAPEGPWTTTDIAVIDDPTVILPQPVPSTAKTCTPTPPPADGKPCPCVTDDKTKELVCFKPDINYGAKQHPALMSNDGKSIVLGYARPLGPFRGEVRLMRVTFQ